MSLIELKQGIEKEKDIKGKKVIYGSKQTIKWLKKGSISKVFLSRDCPEKEEIKELAKKHKADVIELEKTADEIKEAIKKPFSSKVISFMK